MKSLFFKETSRLMQRNTPRCPLSRAALSGLGLLLAACGTVSGSPEARSQEAAASKEPFKPSTSVKIDRSFWVINGKRACQGSPAEGLLLNVRMANVIVIELLRFLTKRLSRPR